MKLGGSLRRGRRKGRGSSSGRARSPQSNEERRALWIRRLQPWGIVFGGITIGYLIATMILFPAPRQEGDLHTAPDVIGLERAVAEQRVTEDGLTLSRVDSMHHPQVSRGQVIGQSPLGGQLVRDGGSMRLTYSLGPETRPVPDILALRFEGARTVLEASGFSVRADSVDAELPRGRVVSIDPEPGTLLELPNEVRLTVSLGPPLVALPDVVGMTEEEARDALRASGLGVSRVDTRFQFGRNQGIVLEQDPEPGTMIEQGSEIRLVVGRRGRGGS